MFTKLMAELGNENEIFWLPVQKKKTRYFNDRQLSHFSQKLDWKSGQLSTIICL
jgi:hypothetical protein